MAQASSGRAGDTDADGSDAHGPEQGLKAELALFFEARVWDSVKRQTMAKYHKLCSAIDKLAIDYDLTEREAFTFFAKQVYDQKASGDTVATTLYALRKLHLARQIDNGWTELESTKAMVAGMKYGAGEDMQRRARPPRYPYTTTMIGQVLDECMKRHIVSPHGGWTQIGIGCRLMFETGLRRGHLSKLAADCVKQRDGKLVLWVNGLKGRSQSMNGIFVSASKEIMEWCEEQTERGPHEKLLPQWSVYQARMLLQDVAKQQAWEQGWSYDLHGFRYAFVHQCRQQGISPSVIKAIGNWAQDSSAFEGYAAMVREKGIKQTVNMGKKRDRTRR